ncbi:hypothetical protein FB451DRAFT_121241 [Mycena latifolia]|nr:hypothetical protein FB451DRAFT_121241 [Mycena latifolia]
MLFEHLRENLANINISLDPYASNMRAAPAELVERRKSVKLQLDAVVYPVLTLPPEITSEIFIKSVEGDYPILPWDKLLLLQICHLWRVIALSTPLLWASLDLSLERCAQRFIPGAPVSTDFIDGWISRACGIPVSLGLYGSGVQKGGDLMRTVLRQYSSHVRYLGLLMDAVAVTKLMDIGPFPLLQKLTLGGFARHSVPGGVHIFPSAPLLREVSLERGAGIQCVALPWTQLTSLNGEGLSTLDCLRLLRHTPMLTKCAFSGIYDANPSASPVIVHPSLKELSISQGAGELVQFLDLPALRALSLTYATFPADALASFFTRSPASLRQFTYFPAATRASPAPASLDWFRAMSGLTSLTVGDHSDNFIDTFFRALNCTTDSGFLPHLRALEVHALSFTVDAPVIDALRSRFAESDVDAGAGFLESVRFVCCSRHYDIDWEEAGDIDWDALYNLAERGLDVHIGPEKENFLWDW